MHKATRSWLFVPGNQERKIRRSVSAGADVVILDLEDSVPEEERAQARHLAAGWVSTAVEGIDWAVRINSPAKGGLEDLDAVTAGSADPDYVLVPKVEAAEDLDTVRRHLVGIGRSIWLVPMIETAIGLYNIHSILADCDMVNALAFGAEDFARSLGMRRTGKGAEIMHARSVMVVAAHAKGLQAIDTVYSFLDDETGFVEDVKVSRGLGFTGKFAIHPAQVEPINAAFSPTQDELNWARSVVEAYERALGEGSGVLRLDGAMIDMAMVRNARRILS